MRVGLAVILLAILAGTGLGVYTQVRAFSYRDLLAALTARGATVHETGTASNLTFQGAGHNLTINGALVAAYSYSTTMAAQFDASRVSSDGATFRGGFWPFMVDVDWIATPHHYKRGRVIVTYIGDDVTVMRLFICIMDQ